MALPVKTTTADVKKFVSYLRTKPTGATIKDAKSSLGAQAVDGRKLSAFKVWGLVEVDGDKYKLTDRSWKLVRQPDQETRVFREILDGIKPYRSALE